MKHQVKVSGYIEVDEVPAIGSELKATIVAEVDGDHRDRRKRKGGRFVMERTAPATINGEESVIESIAPPARDPELPMDESGEE
jgi:hypothetical protein